MQVACLQPGRDDGHGRRTVRGDRKHGQVAQVPVAVGPFVPTRAIRIVVAAGVQAAVAAVGIRMHMKTVRARREPAQRRGEPQTDVAILDEHGPQERRARTGAVYRHRHAPVLGRVVAGGEQHGHAVSDHALDEGDLVLGSTGHRISRLVGQKRLAERFADPEDIVAPELPVPVEFRGRGAEPAVPGVAVEQHVAVGIQAEQVNRAAAPARFGDHRLGGEIAQRFQFQRGATHELRQPPVAALGIENRSVDFVGLAGGGQIAAVEPRGDHGIDAVPLDPLDV